ncbi:MAG TPA: response regulator [Dissulfurispiraceae bacterium]|nr:response regulator [Dissulfurispiraceae bacterium]
MKTMTAIVMIIDDDSDDLELTVMAIESLGRDVSVRSASGGREALAMLRDDQPLPDLVLLDLKMPGMNGIDVLIELRRDDHLKKIPVVMVSSSSLESDRAASFKAGANGYLHKAFDMSEFSNEIEAVLNNYIKT